MNHRPNLRSKVLGVLASVLAVGALAPQINNASATNVREQATLSRVGVTPQKAAAGAAQSSASGSQLAALLGGGGGYSAHRGGGVPPNVWGMSRACKRMVTQHAHAKHIGYRRFHF
jgi:hypothetical protein